MIKNRIEWLSGRQWAKDVCMDAGSLLGTTSGPDKLLEMLRRGLTGKPADYVLGVREIIALVEDSISVQAMRASA